MCSAIGIDFGNFGGDSDSLVIKLLLLLALGMTCPMTRFLIDFILIFILLLNTLDLDANDFRLILNELLLEIFVDVHLFPRIDQKDIIHIDLIKP